MIFLTPLGTPSVLLYTCPNGRQLWTRGGGWLTPAYLDAHGFARQDTGMYRRWLSDRGMSAFLAEWAARPEPVALHGMGAGQWLRAWHIPHVDPRAGDRRKQADWALYLQQWVRGVMTAISSDAFGEGAL